jgi:quinol-cytochrome oxidoreductase complex cytochrome b subunit
MPGTGTTIVDLLWVLLVPLGVVLFVLLRRPKRSFALVLTLAIASIAIGWAVFYAWMYLSFDSPHEGKAFNSLEYLKREVPTGWLWRYLATFHGWIPGVIVFGIALAAARLWPRRAPA